MVGVAIPNPTSLLLANSSAVLSLHLSVRCVQFLWTLPKLGFSFKNKAVVGDAVTLPKYRGMLGTVATIAREEGLSALWKGIVPGLHRQCLNGGLRIALYEPNFYVGANHVGDVPLSKKILAGFTTGAMAIAVANPTDLVKVRLKQKENYLLTILKIPGFTNNVVTHLLAGLGAGLFAVCVGSPVDVVKSRMMGDSSYKSTLDCFIKTLKNYGPFAFYKGFMPNFGRLGSWNVIMFLTLEQWDLAVARIQVVGSNLRDGERELEDRPASLFPMTPTTITAKEVCELEVLCNNRCATVIGRSKRCSDATMVEVKFGGRGFAVNHSNEMEARCERWRSTKMSTPIRTATACVA
ncbi:Mitochondrial uncoupling protein 2 [Spatholobus suberectus]|nr:Mitochondrial uncoupling protein 2 [Spatholobus suberectus]